jgi:type IV secretory pathway VirB10-like protein
VCSVTRAVNTFGQSRLAVTFHRVVLPNKTHVDLDEVPGLNQAGDLGLVDQVNRHYRQIFGASLALGAIAGFAQGRSSDGFDATALDAYRQGVASSVSQSSARVLDRFLNLLPTVTIREGHRITVYLTRDLELPVYHPAFPLPGGRP